MKKLSISLAIAVAAAATGVAVVGGPPAAAQTTGVETQATCPGANMPYEAMVKWMSTPGHQAWMDSPAHEQMYDQMEQMHDQMGAHMSGGGMMTTPGPTAP